jgi:hypothetical protein
MTTDTTLSDIHQLLVQLGRVRFYGSLEIKLEAGRVVLLKKTDQLGRLSRDDTSIHLREKVDQMDAESVNPAAEPNQDNTAATLHSLVALSETDAGCIEILSWKAGTLRQINGDDYEKMLPVLLRERQNNLKCKGASISDEAVQLIALVKSKEPVVKKATGKAGTKAKSKTYAEIQESVKNAPGEIVEQLIPEKSVNLFAGDSGLGKTPLLMQMGLSVASGRPFLRFAVRRGRVLYIDYENGTTGIELVLRRLGKSMGLDGIPDDFRVLQLPDSLKDVEHEIQDFRPTLVIVDSLRGLDSKAESENKNASELLKDLHQMAVAYEAAFLLIHHLRKPNRDNPPGQLAITPVMQWFEQVAGARALVNQSDVRIGCERGNDDTLVLKGHYKLVGEFGPFQIGRVLDESGDPLGYQRRVGVALLSKGDQITFGQLPDGEFTFTQAEQTYGKKGGHPTARFLKRCQDAGVLKKEGTGRNTRYRKVGQTLGEVKEETREGIDK